MGQAVAFQIKSFTFAGKHIYQDIRMKKVFKLAGGFMVGACIGFVGIIGVRVLVLGDSFDGLHSKFAETGMLETVGVSLLAILILLFSIFLQVLLHEGGHLVSDWQPATASSPSASSTLPSYGKTGNYASSVSALPEREANACLPHPKGLLKISQPPCTTWVECLPTC